MSLSNTTWKFQPVAKKIDWEQNELTKESCNSRLLLPKNCKTYHRHPKKLLYLKSIHTLPDKLTSACCQEDTVVFTVIATVYENSVPIWLYCTVSKDSSFTCKVIVFWY